MAKKAKLFISTKVHFRKPSKSLSNLSFPTFLRKDTVPKTAKTRFLIQAAKNTYMAAGQLESLRVSIRRSIKNFRKSFVLIRPKPTTTICKRALETRMGKGKGAPYKSVALVHKGQILAEISGVYPQKMKAIFAKVRGKISSPVKLTCL